MRIENCTCPVNEIVGCLQYRVTWRHLVSFLALWLVCPAGLTAQHYPVRHFGTESGLPKSMVAGIAQDEDGFLWVGTSGGICRFDGTDFSLLDTTPPLEYFYAKSFLRDSRGGFWLGMEENGLVHVHGNTSRHFSKRDGLLDNSVWALAEDSRGNVWVGTGEGLVVLRSEDRERGDFQFHPAFEPQLTHTEVSRIVEDSRGRLWISTRQGLFLAVDGQLVHQWPEARPGRCLTRHPEGFVLVAMHGGLFRSLGDSLTAYCRDTRLDEFHVVDMACSGTTIWIATFGEGLLKLEAGNSEGGNPGGGGSGGGSLEVIGERNGLITDYLYSLFVDREDNLWIGSIHGLSQLFEFAFINYTKEDGLIANSVHALAEDGMGNMFLGGDDGLSIITKDSVLVLAESSEHIPLRRIITMTSQEQMENVTAWTDDGKKFRFSVCGNRASAVLLGDEKSAVRGTHSELTDRFGNQWLSTPDSGIYCTTVGGTQQHWTMGEGLPTNSIFEAEEDTSGAVWFSTIGEGLLRFRDGRIDHFTTIDGLPSDHVECILVHPVTKELWFSTNEGPARWRGDSARPRFETFPAIQELQSRDFSAMVSDRTGNLWFTTSAGVVRFDGRKFEIFTHEHGLLGGESLGITADSEGRVWVGGPRGASEIVPEKLGLEVKPPKVFLTRVESKTGVLTRVTEARLSHAENDLLFVYQGLSLRYPKGLLYSFRLDGVSTDWSPFAPQGEVRFPSLPPGNYRFSVLVKNVRGAVSEAPAEFSFTILSPVWQQWWFLLAVFLLLFFAARAAYRWRVAHLLAVERMRTHIAADLHDDIASSLASVALYAEVIQRQMQNVSEEVRSHLVRIRDLSREVMDNIGVIVWTVDPRYDDLSELLRYFQRYADQICSAVGISFHARFPDKLKPLVLTPEHRRTIYLVLKEALTNILRHARCSEVEFVCEFYDGTLDLTLRDNGLGFDADAVGGGHGISNMRMRAKRIGAGLDIVMRPEGGTVLRLRLKMT